MFSPLEMMHTYGLVGSLQPRKEIETTDKSSALPRSIASSPINIRRERAYSDECRPAAVTQEGDLGLEI